MSNNKVTSLSEQLKKLQVPHAKWLLSNESNAARRRVSFLYEPKEAANMDSESVYCVAKNGLEQLKLIDAALFSSFDESLFAATSIEFERAVQSKHTNETLSGEITRFLHHLSPYYMLKASHKCLEWLVYRYHAHHYEANALLLSMLAYHETNYFIRALQMIDLSDHVTWQWLAASQKAGVPIASHTVAQHLVHDPSFFNLFTSHVTACERTFAASGHQNGTNLIATLCTKLLIQSIELNGASLSESYLAQLLPFLYTLLKSKTSAEMRQCAYLALSLLHQKCTFLKESSEKSVYALAKSIALTPLDMGDDEDAAVFYSDPGEELALKSALMSLCLLIKSQKQMIFTHNFTQPDGSLVTMATTNFITKSAMKKLVKNVGDKRLVSQIDALNEEKNISEFLKCFIDRLLIDYFEGSVEYEALLVKLVATLSLKSDYLINYLIENLFQLLSVAISDEESGKKETSSGQKFVIKVLKKLEAKYAGNFDAILSRLAEKSGDEGLEKAIAIFSLKSSAVGFKYASLEGTSLTLALVHPNELVRVKAVDYLRESLASKNGVDEGFYREQLTLKIDADPSYRVLKALLAFKRDLTRFIPVGELVVKIIQRLFTMAVPGENGEEICGCRRSAIEVLFNSLYTETDRDLFVRAFVEVACFIVEINGEELATLLVKSTKFVAEVMPALTKCSIGNLFGELRANLAKNKKVSEAYLASISVASQNDRFNLKTFFDLEMLLSPKTATKSHLMKVFAILNTLKDSVALPAKASSLEVSLKELNKDTNCAELMQSVKNQKTDPLVFMRFFTQFIDTALESPENGFKESIFSHICINSVNRNVVYILLLDYFAHANADKHFDHFLITLLLRPSTKKSDTIEESVLKLRSLHLLNNLIETDLSEPDLTTMALTQTLTNTNQTIRIEALKCLEKVKKYETKWHTFAKKLLKTREELEMDPEYITNGSKLSKILTREHLDSISTLIPHHRILLSLLRNVDESLKATLIPTIISQIKLHPTEIEPLALKWYLTTPQSAEYFNTHTEDFTYILTSKTIDKVSLIECIVSRSDFFSTLSPNLQNDLIDSYYGQLLSAENALKCDDLQKGLVKLLSSAHYFNSLAQRHLAGLTALPSAKTTKEMKKALSNAPVAIELPKVRLFISLLHSRLSNACPTGPETLIGLLFAIIHYSSELECHEAFDEQQADSVTITALNCLSHIYQHADRTHINEAHFNMDLLVQLLKRKPHFNTSSLQVQQNVLILLSEVAPLFADKILEHVITMFVFVGDKLARKDDLYSFEIINKTMDTILPAILSSKLAATSAGNGSGINATIAKVLQSFVVSLGHIPAHRKSTIFSRLLRIIGLDSYLWLSAIQLIDFYLVENRANSDKSALRGALNAFTPLYVQFEPKHVVVSAISLIEFVESYLNVAVFRESDKARKSQFDAIGCSFENYTQLEDKYLVYHLVVFLNDLLLDDLFRANLEQQENGLSGELFEKFLERLLVTILGLNRQIRADKLSGDDAKFVKSILNKMYDCMEHAINCLDSQQFIAVVRKLLKHEQLAVKRRVLSLLNGKLRRQEPSEDEASLLLGLVDDLIEALQVKTGDNESANNEIEIHNQTILFSFKLLSKRIGDKHSLAFLKVLKYLCENLLTKKQSCNMLSSVLLCLGELCLKLKSSALPYLNKIVGFLLDLLEAKETLGNDLLVLSSVTCLLKIVQSLSNFLSPYLKRIVNLSAALVPVKGENAGEGSQRVHNISVSSDIGGFMDIEQPTSQSQGGNSKTLMQLDAKLSQLRSCLATSVSIRLLAPIIHEETNAIGKAGAGSNIRLENVEYYMQLVKMAVKSSSQEDIVTNIKPLRAFFMNLFNLRTLNAAYKSPKELCKYEDFVLETYCEMTLKLSEELFRPMFFRVYEWATMNDPPKDRLITFYRLTYKLSDRLKNLFVLFSSHFIMNAVHTLDALNASKSEEGLFINAKERTKFTFATEKSSLLLFNLVDTLSNLFLHDSDKFILNNDRFSTIMQPLVDQIENEIEFDSYKKFIDESLSNCIRNFASLCSHDDVLCRKLNYQILLKTKSNSVHVRLASLTVLDKVSKQMGDMYNSIFPETAPFLAELMEDPVEEVEEKVQKYIKDLEEMLGESLQGHFV